MQKELAILGELLIDKKKEIAEKVHTDRMAGTPQRAETPELKAIIKHIMDIRMQFFALVGEALIHYPELTEVNEQVITWGQNKGEYCCSIGAPLDETLMDMRYFREHIWKEIRSEARTQGMSADTIFDVISVIDPLLDNAIYHTSIAYVNAYQKSLDNAKSAFLELSVPVIPIIKGVGVLPLIGDLDTERAKLLLEETLNQSAKLNLTHLVLDVSGVMIMDTMVANELFKVVDALGLIGVETIITGIRPEIAQTMVQLGIKFEKFRVKANLLQAFKELRLSFN